MTFDLIFIVLAINGWVWGLYCYRQWGKSLRLASEALNLAEQLATTIKGTISEPSSN